MLLHQKEHGGIQETKGLAAHLRTELEGQLTPLQIESINVHVGEMSLESVVEGLLR